MNRKFFALVLILSAIFSNEAYSVDYHIKGPVEYSSHDLVVINVLSLTNQTLNEFFKGQCPHMVVEFSANTLLPLQASLKGDLINWVGNEVQDLNQVQIKQTFYLQCIEGEFLLSSNLINWKPFFEFITGAASIGLGSQEGQVFITIGADVSQR